MPLTPVHPLTPASGSQPDERVPPVSPQGLPPQGHAASRRPALRFPVASACRLVRMLAGEMAALAGERVPLRRDSRRTVCLTRQIAMYVCHVALQIPQADIGAAFGKDRTTVSHACKVVEDRRDDRAFDDFVSALERISRSVFALREDAGE